MWRLSISLCGIISLTSFVGLTGCNQNEPSDLSVEPTLEGGSADSLLADTSAFTNKRGSVVFRPTAEESASIKDSVRGFLSARTVEALEPYVLYSERVLPLAQQYYSQRPFLSGSVRVDPEFRSVGQRIVAKVFIEGRKFPRLLALEKTDAGYKIDWELFVMHSSMAWADVIPSMPETPVVLRGILQPADTTDSEKAYTLMHPFTGERIELVFDSNNQSISENDTIIYLNTLAASPTLSIVEIKCRKSSNQFMIHSATSVWK